MMPQAVPEAFCIGQPRLTAGLDRLRRIDRAGYQTVFGKVPRLTAEQLISMAEQVDLRGRGGAAFPVARKLSAALDAAPCSSNSRTVPLASRRPMTMSLPVVYSLNQTASARSTVIDAGNPRIGKCCCLYLPSFRNPIDRSPYKLTASKPLRPAASHTGERKPGGA